MLLLDFLVTDCGLKPLVVDEILLERGNGSSQEMGFCSSAMIETERIDIN